MDQEGTYSNKNRTESDLAMVLLLEKLAHLPAGAMEFLRDPLNQGTKIPIHIDQPQKLRQRQTRLTEPQRAALVEKYQAGATLNQVAAEFQVDRKTARAALEKAGVQRRERWG